MNSTKSLSMFLLSSLFLFSACGQAVAPSVSSTSSNENSKSLSSYTVSDVSLHNTKEDCFVASEGEVFDITDFLSKHKVPLEEYCGTSDKFESAFLGQHGDSKKGLLKGLKVGTLTN